tara:strand:- start:97 stop:588 length:492 start_codon:yes stop_codon:yes gene_type:complete
MTETDKRYFIKRINEIKTDLINNEPESPKMTFDEYKDLFDEMLESVYLNSNKSYKEKLVRNLFTKVQNGLMKTIYYGDHSFSLHHVTIGAKQLIPDFDRIEKELDLIRDKRKKEETKIFIELNSKANDICDHIRFDDIEEHYGKTIKDVIEDFRNFYTTKKAA